MRPAMQDAMSRRYQSRSRELLAKAREELSSDVAQASEKAWGAAASMVKSVAVARGWGHQTHGLLHDAVDQLIAETGDRELGALFTAANGLHQNFYEDWSTKAIVESGIDSVQKFLDKLDALPPPTQG